MILLEESVSFFFLNGELSTWEDPKNSCFHWVNKCMFRTVLYVLFRQERISNRWRLWWKERVKETTQNAGALPFPGGISIDYSIDENVGKSRNFCIIFSARNATFLYFPKTKLNLASHSSLSAVGEESNSIITGSLFLSSRPSQAQGSGVSWFVDHDGCLGFYCSFCYPLCQSRRMLRRPRRGSLVLCLSPMATVCPQRSSPRLSNRKCVVSNVHRLSSSLPPKFLQGWWDTDPATLETCTHYLCTGTHAHTCFSLLGSHPEGSWPTLPSFDPE